MASTDQASAKHALWQEAIVSALGPLAAYLTPKNYGLSSVSLDASDDGEDSFLKEIQRRLDLARAVQAAELIDEVGADPPQAYRHTVHYCEDRIDGALLVPRLIRERAAGRRNRIPVLRAANFAETPEALLVSESLRVSRLVSRSWKQQNGAEGRLAQEIDAKLAQIGNQQPWLTLSLRPRPALHVLASTVKSRTVSGWNTRGGAIDRLCDLVLNKSAAVSASAGLIAFLVSQDRRFEDRLYELICLGWMLGALKDWDPAGSVRPQNIRKKGPIFVGQSDRVKIEFHYQAGYMTETARYCWQNGKQLRAIPDFSIEIESPNGRASIILDAKNRAVSSDSEIVYKLIGYQENLGIRPYIAVGIAPTDHHRASSRRVTYQDRNITVLRLPLGRGAKLVKRGLRLWVKKSNLRADEICA